ncbi:MAG TPA: glycosyltransferase [Clostridiales bacterium]|nr:glycosyltransferase [Clostridiales bacterium]HQP69017.1 glycosyltransferase [Clostridiales bacterium]
MKKLLIVSPNFPPIGGIGVQRITKLIKYLVPLKYEITVLTVPENSTRLQKDPSMMHDVPSNVRILRPFYFDYKKIVPGELSKLFKPFERKYLFPDRFRMWNYFCLREIKKLVKEEKFDFVLVNAPPFSGVELSYRIKNETGLKVFLNLRDPFSFNNYNILKENDIKRSKALDIEKKAVAAVDGLITVTPSHYKNYSELFPEFKDKIRIVTNGFDNDDFQIDSSVGSENRFFKIGYSGSFSTLAPLEQLLEAIYELNMENGTNIKFSIATNQPGSKVRGCHKKCYDSGFVEFLGFLPHKESIKNLCRSHLLAMVFANSPATEGSYPGKVFEYFKVKRPIILLNNNSSDIAELIKKTKSGSCVNIDDKNEIKQTILKYYQEWLVTKKIDFSPDNSEINNFDYKNIVIKLDRVLNGGKQP